MKYIVKKYHKGTPDEVLIADLRKTAKRLGKVYISMKEYAASGEFHSSTIYDRFGGWNIAAAKAGLKIQINRNVTRDELMVNIRKVWDSLGRQPKMNEMVKPLSDYGKAVYANRFGSWLEALNEFVTYMNRVKNKCAGFSPGKKLLNKNANRSYKKSLGKRKKVRNCSKIISMGLRFTVFKRDKFKCRICGASPAKNPKVELHADHIIPRAKGGETILSNLQTLCSKCNLGKGTH